MALTNAPDLAVTRIDDWGGIEPLVPFQQFPKLGAHVTGLLYGAGPQAWGTPFRFNGTPTDPKRNEYVFSVDGSSAWSVYFTPPEGGMHPLKNWSFATPHGKSARHDIAWFGPANPNPWGLARSAHVVDFEVNDGDGGIGPTFIATRVRTRDTPVERLLFALRRRFDGDVAANELSLDDLAAKAGSGPGGCTLGPRTRTVSVWPTWSAKDGALDVVFTMRETAPSTQACVTNFALLFAASYRVRPEGTLVRATLYAPMAVGVLPAPGPVQRASPAEHLAIESAVSGGICSGIPYHAGTFFTIRARLTTDAQVRLEALRRPGECHALTMMWSNRSFRPNGVAMRRGDVLQIGSDYSGDATLGEPATCAGAPLAQEDAELFYRVRGRLYYVALRFNPPPPRGPCP
jgi:hypothetical protein